MQNPLDSIPFYEREHLKKIQQYAQSIELSCGDEFAFSGGIILARRKDSEYDKSMQYRTRTPDDWDEMIKMKHPWAMETLEKNYWKYLMSDAPHNAGACAIALEISENQMNIDLVKAQMYVFLEEIGLENEEDLAEEMAGKIINGESPEDVFTSYVKNGTIELEEAESEIDESQQNNKWECEYCGSIFNSYDEAYRHEEVCEMRSGEDEESDELDEDDEDEDDEDEEDLFDDSGSDD